MLQDVTGTLSARARHRPGLLDWLDEPVAGKGLRFAEDGEGWSFWEYPRLARLVASTAQQIVDQRSAAEGPVAIVLPTGPGFVAAFQGALLAGHTPCPLAGPLFVRDTAQYVDHVAGMLRAAQPALIITDETLEAELTEAAAMAGVATPVRRLEMEEGDLPVRPRAAELALLQFTSGSSGRPRAVRVSWDNLEANIAQMRTWIRMEEDDQLATWMPMYHDMGLIGCVLVPLVNQSDVWILRPDQFIRDPARWLECFGVHGAQIGGGTNFAYAYAAKRVREERLEGMDFSSWRCAVVGAERLDAAALGGFARKLMPHGFKAEGFMPAFGMAEGTLAITGVPVPEVTRVVRPEWSTARFGGPVTIADTALLVDTEHVGAGDGWLVGCGPPLPGVEVSIVDDEGEDLPECSLGEIAVRGANVADGYLGAEGSSTRFADGRVYTGDAGFIAGDDLFVIGRLGDSIKVRGRFVFAEDVEARLGAVDGIPKGKCVVLAGAQAESNVLAAVVEGPAGDWLDEAVAILRSEVGDDARFQVLAGGPQTIQRTSSGKPRRRLMWDALADGTLGAELLHDSGG